MASHRPGGKIAAALRGPTDGSTQCQAWPETTRSNSRWAGSQASKVETSTWMPCDLATLTIRESGSTPSTSRPLARNSRATLPVPQPTSSTRDGVLASRSSTIAAGYEGRVRSKRSASAPNHSARRRFSYDTASAGSGGLLLGVDRFDFGAVLLRDPLPLDLHRGGQLVADHEVGIEDRPLLDLFGMGEATVDVGDRFVDEAPGPRVVRAGFGLGDVRVECDQRRHEGAAIAEHDRLRDAAVVAKAGLHGARRHVFSARGLEEILLSIGDLEEAVLIEFPDVARLQPAIHQRLAGCLHILEVAAEHVVAFHQDLAVGRDSDLDPGQGPADSAEAGLARAVEAGRRGGLGQPVALEDLDAQAIKEPENVWRHGGRAADADLDLVEAEPLADFAEDQPVGQTPLPLHPGRGRLAMLVGRGSQRAHHQRPIADDAPGTPDLVHFGANPGKHLFPEPWHRGEVGG